MPLQIKMGVALTPLQRTALNGAFDTIENTLTGVMEVNLTPEERQSARSAKEARKPYIDTTLQDLVVSYPDVIPNYTNPVDANNDYIMMNDMIHFALRAVRTLEIITDMGINVEDLLFKFMTDLYDQAKRAALRNVPGSNAIVDALAPLFEQQNNTPPRGGGEPEPPGIP